MSATILRFPAHRAWIARHGARALPAPFTAAWCEHHLPLIDAAMDLLQADDAEIARRCALMVDEEGRDMVGALASQLERLGAHIGCVEEALVIAAERVREAMVSSADRPA